MRHGSVSYKSGVIQHNSLVHMFPFSLLISSPRPQAHIPPIMAPRRVLRVLQVCICSASGGRGLLSLFSLDAVCAGGEVGQGAGVYFVSTSVYILNNLLGVVAYTSCPAGGYLLLQRVIPHVIANES